MFNLSLVTLFSYILFNGELEKRLSNVKNKNNPVIGYVIAIDKSASSSNQFPRLSKRRKLKTRSSVYNNQENTTIALASNLESFYGDKSQLHKGRSRELSYSNRSIKLIDTEDRESTLSISGGSAIYAGTRKGGTVISERANYTFSKPFSDGISMFPRSSVPRSQDNTLFIDPQENPLEEDRIPVGEGLGVMLLFAAAFAGKVYRGR